MSQSDPLRERLCTLVQGRFLIVGIGSPLKGDDQAGLLACSELQSRGVECVSCEYGLENCIDYIIERRPRVLIILDTVLFEGGRPGDIVIIGEDAIVEGAPLVSTHTISLRALLNVLKVWGAIKEVFIIGVYPESLELGADVSYSVLNSVKMLIDRMSECIKGTLSSDN